MWVLIKIGNTWHAENYKGESDVIEDIDNVFDNVIVGNIVCIADDLESWCNEMGVVQTDVIVVD